MTELFQYGHFGVRLAPDHSHAVVWEVIDSFDSAYFVLGPKNIPYAAASWLRDLYNNADKSGKPMIRRQLGVQK